MKNIFEGFLAFILMAATAQALEIPLVRNYPDLAKIPRLEILKEYTPVRAMPGLQSQAYKDNSKKLLWVKLDDRSEHLLGGNKSRKLEFILGKAKDKKATTLLTSGMWGSNHAHTTAIAAKEYGFKIHLTLGPQPVTENVKKKVLANHTLGAKQRYYSNKVTMGLRLARDFIKGSLSKRYFYIPPGGTSSEGTIGYVNGLMELVDQLPHDQLPDEIYLPVGTAGTAAGLLVGTCLSGLYEKIKIVGIGISHGLLSNESLVRKKAKAVHKLLSKYAKIPKCNYKSKKAFSYEKKYSNPGYGSANNDVFQAMKTAKEVEGLILDPTYSGKAFLAYLERVKNNEKNQKILFWHTYNSHSLDDLINNFSWTNPEKKWLDLPKKFRKIFKD